MGFKQGLKDYGTVAAGVLIVAVFSLLSPDKFCTLDNLLNISRQISLLVIISMGATLVMIVDEFDLSIGAMASLGGVLAALLAVAGQPLAVCFLLPLVICFGMGLINGWIITRFGVLSFISTLAMNTILTGVIYRLTGGGAVFQNIPQGFGRLGNGVLGRIPYLTLIMLLLTVVLWLAMSRLVSGRRLYAIGGNRSAARMAGIPIQRYTILAFGFCALLAAGCGVLLASRLSSAQPTAGEGYFLQAYAAVFLGRTVFKGGVPNVWGTFVGAAILGVISNGLTIMRSPSYAQDIITGVIIILAVIVQKLGEKGEV